MVNDLYKRSIQDRGCWGHLPRRIDDYPAPPCGLDGDIRLLTRWISGLGPIETSDIARTYEEVMRMLDHNAGAAYDDARWVAIDGPSHVGKTYTIIPVLLRINDMLLRDERPPKREGVKSVHVPVIYVGDQGASSKTLVESIAEFAGIFVSRSDVETTILRRLRTILPLIGCLLIVVDEGHMLRRVGASRDLTDNLRRLLSLPVSFVFVGAGLRDSALYRRTDVLRVPQSERPAAARAKPSEGLLDHPDEAAMQLRNRMKAVQLRAFDSSNSDHLNAWLKRMNGLVSQLERIPGLDVRELKSREFAVELFTFAQGRTGTSFLILKDVCELAVRRRESPTIQHLHVEMEKAVLTP
ncbi:hypothetical protein QSJ19_17385 [Gordonia sp. ABSL11-1]|uniref:hypothetical protein n=1 Tax=Gordonia sp. ABSL11-1 TaxID=3053924 RepID=UPI0025739DA8|nr:hypothetical protein [Gordonia sp. ABSL11-1]MDL9947319.1 hypothetical protein [Gordonia sp. ABSL11-1]